jgi:lipid-binding SYLF domain-containing protein
MNAIKALTLSLGAGMFLAFTVAPGCSTAPETQADKDALGYSASGAVASFTGADSSLQALLNRAAGYAVFPEIGKAGFIAGGAYGRGEVFEGGKKIGYADVTKGSVGLQAGAQTFAELIVFMTPEKLNNFKQGKFTLSADASAVAIKAGAAGASDVSKGVVVFVQPKGGLMFEASVGGQSFTYVSLKAAR